MVHLYRNNIINTQNLSSFRQNTGNSTFFNQNLDISTIQEFGNLWRSNKVRTRALDRLKFQNSQKIIFFKFEKKSRFSNSEAILAEANTNLSSSFVVISTYFFPSHLDFSKKKNQNHLQITLNVLVYGYIVVIVELMNHYPLHRFDQI